MYGKLEAGWWGLKHFFHSEISGRRRMFKKQLEFICKTLNLNSKIFSGLWINIFYNFSETSIKQVTFIILVKTSFSTMWFALSPLIRSLADFSNLYSKSFEGTFFLFLLNLEGFFLMTGTDKVQGWSPVRLHLAVLCIQVAVFSQF